MSPQTTPKPQKNAKTVTQPHDKAYKLMFADPVMVQEFCEDFLDEEIVATLDFEWERPQDS